MYEQESEEYYQGQGKGGFKKGREKGGIRVRVFGLEEEPRKGDFGRRRGQDVVLGVWGKRTFCDIVRKIYY